MAFHGLSALASAEYQISFPEGNRNQGKHKESFLPGAVSAENDNTGNGHPMSIRIEGLTGKEIP